MYPETEPDVDKDNWKMTFKLSVLREDSVEDSEEENDPVQQTVEINSTVRVVEKGTK